MLYTFILKQKYKKNQFLESEKRKMEKMGLLKSDKMGQYEREQGYASYKTIVDYFIGDIVLCNKVAEIDDSIFENIEYDYKKYGELMENFDIYQYYLCNLSDWEKERAIRFGLIVSYSDTLDCDVLCVDHFGTSWDYVLTNVKLFDTYEELQAYEDGGNNEE